MSTKCPCGTGLAYADCCGPYIKGIRSAPTAEAMMRSRYTAYAMGEIYYLGETLHPDSRGDWDRKATQDWADESTWLELKVLDVQAGEESNEEEVEFIASFEQQGVTKQHHERSLFQRLEGRWYYLDGSFPKPVTHRNEGAKIGRNEPCPCGSGKKYKKCCGR